jgi:hypothetical protein
MGPVVLIVAVPRLSLYSCWYDEVHPRFEASTAFPHFVAGPSAAGSPSTAARQNGHDVDMLLGITVLDPEPR